MINTLAVDGIDLELIRQTDTGGYSARLHIHGMAWRVPNFERLAGRLAVIREGFDLVYLLVQATAESHVCFLGTATDVENRNTSAGGGASQRQRDGVVVGVVEDTGLACRSTIMTGLDVQRRASEEQTVDAV